MRALGKILSLTETASPGASRQSRNSNNNPSNLTAASAVAAAAPTADTLVPTSLAPGDLPSLPWIGELVISIFVLLTKYTGWLIYYGWHENVGYLRVFRMAVYWIPADIVFLVLYIVGCVWNLNPPIAIPKEWPSHSWPPDWLRYCLLMVLAGVSLPVPAYMYLFGWDHLALSVKPS